MNIIDLYDGIYSVLSNNDVVLSYLGIGEGDNLTKAYHIQKRAKPQNLADHLPLIAFYTLPGKREGRNLNVYTTNFNFDVYTNDNPTLAQSIVQTIISLFDGVISLFDNLETFEGIFVTGYESDSDLPNTYCFTVVIQFSISLEKVQCNIILEGDNENG